MSALRKMDEMEMSVNLKAIQIAWAYSNMFLLAWAIYDWVKMNYFNTMPVILLSSQLLIYWTIQLYLKWNLSKDEK